MKTPKAECIPNPYDYNNNVAYIAFQEGAQAQADADQKLIDEAHKQGRKEALEWINSLHLLMVRVDADGKSYTEIALENTVEYQNKLKELE